jgi:hypothetical protein
MSKAGGLVLAATERINYRFLKNRRGGGCSNYKTIHRYYSANSEYSQPPPMGLAGLALALSLSLSAPAKTYVYCHISFPFPGRF